MQQAAGIARDTRQPAIVAVVGAGPVGLITAIELARQGLRPVVLDAKDGVAWSSRAICISRRSQEILDRIGAGPAFAAKALPWSRGRTFYRDRLVFELDMPYGAGRPARAVRQPAAILYRALSAGHAGGVGRCGGPAGAAA